MHLDLMQDEIFETMMKREPISIQELQLGDLVTIKNYRNGPLDVSSSGPCIFLEFDRPKKISAIVYNTNTRRLHRVKTSHISPM